MPINAAFIGSGFLALKDTSNNAYQAGVLQDVSLNIDTTTKKLMGANKVAVLVAATEQNVKLTAKFAQLSSPLVGAVLGATSASGAKYVGTVTKTAAASTFTVATSDFGTPAGWAFVGDLGLVYDANGQPLKFNSGSLASTGEYKNTAAVYTTGSGEATTAYKVSCIYSATAGTTWTANNSAVGLATTFAAYLFQATTQADGTVRKIGWYFPAVMIGKLDLGFKNTDFLTQSLDIEVFQDSSGKIAEMYEV
jgi:hypothetical protein